MTQTVLLGDICSRITDGAHWSPESTENGFPMASVKDMQDYGLNLKTCRKISKEDYQKLVKDGCRPEKDDVLIAKDGSYLKHLFVSDGLADVVLLSSIAILKPNLDLVDPRYLVYYIRNQRDNYDLSQYVSGAAIPRIILKNFARMPIKLPDMKTQKEIVDVLGSIDEKTELNRKMNETLEQMGQALFRHYFVTNPEAENWGKIPIGKKIHPRRGRSLQSRNMISGEIPVISGGLKPAGLHNESNTQAPVITVSASGANAGFVALWETPVWSADSSYIDASITDDVYFYYLFMKANQTNIYGMQTGSGQPHIYPKHIELLEIPNAPNELLKEFHDQVESMFKKIHENDREIENLTALRDTILPKLISGKIKL